MFPHFFGTDMTAALPWFLMGFLLSACILGLWNFLSGSGTAATPQQAKPVTVSLPNAQIAAFQERLSEVEADVALARTSAMQIANDKVRIEEQLKKGAAPQAAAGSQDARMAERLAELQADLASAKTAAVQYADEKSRLEAELRKAAKQLAFQASVPAANPLPANAALSDLDIRRRNEIADLSAELWALRKSDVAQTERVKALEAEIARLKAQMSAPSPADLEVKRLNNELGNWKSKIEELTTQLSNKSGFIAMRDAELDRLEALLAINSRATNVVPLNVVNTRVGAAPAPASTPDASKLEAESVRLRAEVGRLSNEVANKTGLIALRDAELDRLESLVKKGTNGAQPPTPAMDAGAPVSAADATKFTSEIIRLRALVDQTRKELSETSARLAAREAELARLQGQTGQTAAYIAEHNQLRAEIARLSQQNAALNLDIANYQRVREALQEANRIASKG